MSEKSFGVKQLNILGSSGTPPQIESAENLRIRVGIGSTVIIGDSDSDFNSPSPSSVDPNNTAVLNVGIVTANEYYGTFKGDIDPGTSTLSIDTTLSDVLAVTDNNISAQTATEDNILFWDSTATKTTYLKIGEGVTIDDATLKGNYSLPVTGDADKATWTLKPGSGTGDPVTLKAGSNISIDASSASSGEFTLNVASGAGITFSSIDVKQYSDLANPRTERTCIDPIVVHIAGEVATIGIGNTSNAYGEKYVQDAEPATSCDGDIWYDTTPPAGGANSGITVANQNANLATLATKLDFVGNGVVASGTGATKTITINNSTISVKDYGAVGDGSTDDTTAIQACFDAVDAMETGANIVFPTGTYKVTDMLKIPFPGYITLIGSGAKIMSYVTEGAAGYGKPTLAYQGSGDTASVVIDGLSFDGTNVGTNGDCIWANPKGTGFIIKNCVFKKFRHHFVHHDPYNPTATPQGANTHILESEFRQATDSSVIWTRLDAGTIRNCLFKSNEGKGIEIGQTTSIPLDLNNFNLSNNYFGGYDFGDGTPIAGKYQSGQSSGMVIDGCLIEDNLRGGIRTYSGRSIIVNADFEVNGAIRAKLNSGGLTGTFAVGDSLSPGGTVLSWNANTRNLIIARTGEFDLGDTITNTTQAGSGTIQELAPYYWQCDLTGNGREGGGFNCTLGRATRFTGKVPHIITSGSTLLQCDIKETHPRSAPGVINTLRGTIVDARQVSWGDAHNRYGQGDVYAPNYPAAGNVYCGGIMVDDPVTLSFTNLTVPDDQDGINFGPIFFLKDYMVAFLGGSITDQGSTEISATGRFFVRNVTDSSRLGDAWTPSTATNTWTPTEKSSLQTITAVAYYDKEKDPGYQDTDQYTFGIRSPVGTGNNLTGFVQAVICFTQTP